MYATSLISEQPAAPALSVEIPTLGLMAWQDVLMKLRTRLDPKRHTFVSHLRLGGLEKGTVKLLVPSDFLRGWVNSYYKDMLLDLWQEQMSEVWRVEVATHGGQVIVNPISSMKGVYLTGKPARRPPLQAARKKAAERPVAVQEVPVLAQSLEQMYEAFALRIWVDTIISEVCRFYKLTRKEMLTGGRAYRIVGPRQKAMYLAHVLTQRSLPEIGKDFGREGGKFDHTTVLHAARKIAAMREADNLVDREVTYLASLIMQRTMLEKTGVTMLYEEQASPSTEMQAAAC